MVLILPSSLIALEELQQLRSTHRVPRGLNQKSAASPRAYKRIDFADQVFR
jgi:hypothetical protein